MIRFSFRRLAVLFLLPFLVHTSALAQLVNLGDHDGPDGSRFRHPRDISLYLNPDLSQGDGAGTSMQIKAPVFFRMDSLTTPAYGSLIRPIIGIVGAGMNKDLPGSNYGLADWGVPYSNVVFAGHYGEDYLAWYPRGPIFQNWNRAVLSAERLPGCTPTANNICPVNYPLNSLANPKLPVVTENGEWVAFSQKGGGAYTWNASDPYTRYQIFLKRFIDPTRTAIGNTALVSDGDLIPVTKTPAGLPSNNGVLSYAAFTIAADGACVVYTTPSTDIVATQSDSGQYASYYAMIKYDRATATNSLIQDNIGVANNNTSPPAVSSDCKWVTYLVAKDQAGCTNSTAAYSAQLKLVNLTTGASYFPSRYPMAGPSGVCTDAVIQKSTISDNGRYIAFDTLGTALSAISGPAYDTNTSKDIYLADRARNTVRRISKGFSTNPSDNLNSGVWNYNATTLALSGADSIEPVLSRDGSYIAYISRANNLQQVATLPGTTLPIVKDFYLGWGGGSPDYDFYDATSGDVYIQKLWGNFEPELVTYDRDDSTSFYASPQWNNISVSAGLSFKVATFPVVPTTDPDYMVFREVSGTRCIFSFVAGGSAWSNDLEQSMDYGWGDSDGSASNYLKVANRAVYGTVPCSKAPKYWDMLPALSRSLAP